MAPRFQTATSRSVLRVGLALLGRSFTPESRTVSALPLQLGRAFHCHLAAVSTSVWYDKCRIQFVGV